MGLRETLEAATPGPWRVDDPMDGESYVIGIVPESDPNITLAMDILVEDATLMALAPELACLALDMGEWTRDFLMGDNIDPGDRADLTALLARLDQIGKEQR